MTLIAFRPLATVVARAKGRESALARVSFWPTSATAERLSRHRIVFRPFPGGFRLAIQHDLERGGGGPLVPIGDELSLLFGVGIGGAGLVPEAARKAGPSLFLSNRNSSGTPQSGPQLSREEAIGPKDVSWIVPRRHRARISLGGGSKPKSVEIRHYFGGGAIGEPLAIEAETGAESAEVTVNLENAEGIAFHLKPKPQGTALLIIADDELAGMRSHAVLELALKTFPGPAPAAGREFVAMFE